MKLTIVGIGSDPVVYAKIDSKINFEEILISNYWCVALINTATYLSVDSENAFIKRYPGALYWQIGRLVSAGLQMSNISAQTLDEPLNPKWKKIANEVKSKTKVGGVAVNPRTGAFSQMRNYRFSEGAANLYLSGTKLLPIVGNIVIEPRLNSTRQP